MMCCGEKCCWGHKLAGLLLVIGGLNWGALGVGYFYSGASWNLVNMLLRAWPTVEYVVYVLVGLSALAMIVGCRCKTCQM